MLLYISLFLFRFLWLGSGVAHWQQRNDWCLLFICAAAAPPLGFCACKCKHRFVIYAAAYLTESSQLCIAAHAMQIQTEMTFVCAWEGLTRRSQLVVH
jgi:hypothetical protein